VHGDARTEAQVKTNNLEDDAARCRLALVRQKKPQVACCGGLVRRKEQILDAGQVLLLAAITVDLPSEGEPVLGNEDDAFALTLYIGEHAAARRE